MWPSMTIFKITIREVRQKSPYEKCANKAARSFGSGCVIVVSKRRGSLPLPSFFSFPTHRFLFFPRYEQLLKGEVRQTNCLLVVNLDAQHPRKAALVDTDVVVQQRCLACTHKRRARVRNHSMHLHLAPAPMLPGSTQMLPGSLGTLCQAQAQRVQQAESRVDGSKQV